LRRYGHLLGVLYHGCDDVADLRGLEALGGGGEEDVRDGILTLPAALAIRDPEIRELFVRDDADQRRLAELAAAYKGQLGEAEAVLERIADSAREEARQFAVDPNQLVTLVEHVRALSRL
jgi:geranylgeranyl pyrophosphate synthase